jgi:transcriptional regulator with GAF, ATPase, and Fis domain
MVSLIPLSAGLFNLQIPTRFTFGIRVSQKKRPMMERNQILKILSETRWRIEGKDKAAAILGLHPSTLRARMHKNGIVRPETKEPD